MLILMIPVKAFDSTNRGVFLCSVVGRDGSVYGHLECGKTTLVRPIRGLLLVGKNSHFDVARRDDVLWEELPARIPGCRKAVVYYEIRP